MTPHHTVNAPDGPLDVIHVDDTLLVLNKPAGLLCVPGRGADKQDCLSTRVQAQYPDTLVVHRLDMATSGLVVMARSLPHQRSLSEAFATRQVHKRYVAVVAGVMQAQGDDWQTIDLPLMPDWPRRPMQKVDHADGKPSVTRWRVLATDHQPHQTRVELEPVTGRTHQLRVHLAAIGHPILGDALYAPEAVAHCVPRLLLHATALQLRHPSRNVTMEFQSNPVF